VGWGQVVRGREQLGLQVFQEAIAYYSRLEAEGHIDGFEPILLGPHGGDLAGFVILRGERAALDAVRSSPEFLRMTVRAASVVDNVGVVPAYTGDALGQLMGIFGEVSAELPQAT
jgi:hypothetical protein